MQTTTSRLLITAWLAFAVTLSAQTTTPYSDGNVVATVNRAVGGIASASSEMSSSKSKENAANAFDGSINTKWFNYPVAARPGDLAYNNGWIQYQFGGGERLVITAYAITSANDVPSRDPKNWEFQGSNDGTTWVTLDTRENQRFSGRHSTNSYSVTNDVAYGYYRLNISEAGHTGYGIQLAELQLMAPLPPAAPVELVAKSANHGIELSWKASPGATGYKVKRAATSGGPYADIAAQATGTTCRDPEPKVGVVYYYVVSALGLGGAGADSGEVSAFLTDPPTGLTAEPGRDQVALHWTAAADIGVTYNLKRSATSAGPFTLIAANIIKPVCTDTGLPGGETYSYVVSSSKAGQESLDSSAVSVTLAPAAPVNLTAIREKRKILVSWAASHGAVSYTLKRAIGAEGPYAVVKQALVETTYSDEGVSGGRTYYYVVSATNAGGESLVSSPASVHIPAWFQRN